MVPPGNIGAMANSPIVEEYRARAAQLRQQAAQSAWHEDRAQLLELALRFDALADGVEEEMSRSPKAEDSSPPTSASTSAPTGEPKP